MSDWRPEHDNAVRRHFLAGLSCAAAAAKLNEEFGTDFTRSAVIGRTNRMKIARSTVREPVRKPRKSKPATARQAKATPAQRPDIAIRKAKSQPKPPTEPAQLRCDPVVPGTVRLLELQPGMCRWPTGEGAENIRFCGLCQDPGQPYCWEHCKIAYRSMAA